MITRTLRSALVMVAVSFSGGLCAPQPSDTPDALAQSDICEHLAQDRPFVLFADGGSALDARARLLLGDIINGWLANKGDVLISTIVTNTQGIPLAEAREQSVVHFLSRSGIPDQRLWTKVMLGEDNREPAYRSSVFLFNRAVGEACYRSRTIEAARWIKNNCLGDVDVGRKNICTKAIEFIEDNP